MKVGVYLAINGEAQPSRAGDILLEFPLSNLYTASMRWVDPQAQCGNGEGDGNRTHVRNSSLRF